MDKTIEQIEKYIDTITDYYENNLFFIEELTSFLKQEVGFFGECLHYIDLTVLPLTQDYIKDCIEKQKKNLEDDDFLSKSLELHKEIIMKILNTKRLVEMSNYEIAVYESFIAYFPCEIETQDLLIYYKYNDIINSHVKPEIVLDILYKHFKDIIDNTANDDNAKKVDK